MVYVIEKNRFLKVLFSWATKPEDCICVLTPTERPILRMRNKRLNSTHVQLMLE